MVRSSTAKWSGLRLPNGQVLENRFFNSAMSETMADKQQAPSDDLIAFASAFALTWMFGYKKDEVL